MPIKPETRSALRSRAQALAGAMDSVLAAFQKYNDELKLACAEASMDGDFEPIKRLVTESRRTDAAKGNFAALSAQWNQGQSDFDQTLAEAAAPDTSDVDLRDLLQASRAVAPSRRRGPNGARSFATGLRVELDNRVIQLESAAETFVETLRGIGFERVSKLGMILSGIPLVSAKDHGTYQGWKRIDGWFVCTHSSTQDKKEILEKVAKRFNVRLRAEIVNG